MKNAGPTEARVRGALLRLAERGEETEQFHWPASDVRDEVERDGGLKLSVEAVQRIGQRWAKGATVLPATGPAWVQADTGIETTYERGVFKVRRRRKRDESAEAKAARDRLFADRDPNPPPHLLAHSDEQTDCDEQPTAAEIERGLSEGCRFALAASDFHGYVDAEAGAGHTNNALRRRGLLDDRDPEWREMVGVWKRRLTPLGKEVAALAKVSSRPGGGNNPKGPRNLFGRSLGGSTAPDGAKPDPALTKAFADMRALDEPAESGGERRYLLPIALRESTPDALLEALDVAYNEGQLPGDLSWSEPVSAGDPRVTQCQLDLPELPPGYRVGPCEGEWIIGNEDCWFDDDVWGDGFPTREDAVARAWDHFNTYGDREWVEFIDAYGGRGG